MENKLKSENLSSRLALLVAVPVAALVITLGIMISNAWENRNKASGVQEMTHSAVLVSRLVHEIQKERGVSAGYIGSNGNEFGDSLASQRVLVEKLLVDLREHLASKKESRIKRDLLRMLDKPLDYLDGLEQIRGQVDRLSISLDEVLAYYSDVNRQLLDVAGHLPSYATDGELSNLSLAYTSLLQIKEKAGIERAVLANTFANDSFAEGVYERFLALTSAQETYIAIFRNLANSDFIDLLNELSSSEAVIEAMKLRRVAINKSSKGGFDVDPKQWFSIQTKKIEKLKTIEDRLASDLLVVAETQKSEATALVGNILLLMFLIVAITVFIARRILSSDKELYAASKKQAEQLWVIERQFSIAEALSSDTAEKDFYQRLLDTMVNTLSAISGAYYCPREDGSLEYQCGNAFSQASAKSIIEVGEGTLGQAVKDKEIRVLENSGEYLLESVFGEHNPQTIISYPLFQGEQVHGAMELAFIGGLNEMAVRTVLENVRTPIVIAVQAIKANQMVANLLQQSQTQSEELQANNEELQRKSQELQAQQEEMAATNEELEEQRTALEEQKERIEQSNIELEKARQSLEIKKTDLENANRYKSEFLANMSHELRTPLNSLLILSKLLAGNESQNLTEDQVNYAQIIHNAGSELLNLINDILDLSKVEVGKLEIRKEVVQLASVVNSMKQLFSHSMKEKGLNFVQSIDESAPTKLFTDQIRLEQILKNLIGNAQKFTEKGEVSLHIKSTGAGKLEFKVTDSGIGIPKEKHEQIFEAFKQIDGSLNRSHAGTGLGLSISNNLADLLGGNITIDSTVGVGSVFTLTVPIGEQSTKTENENTAEIKDEKLEDERKNIQSGDRVLQIIEDDVSLAMSLANYAKQHGFKYVISVDGETGFKDATQFNPDIILLDLGLPKMDGLSVLEKLRAMPSTSNTPIYILSGTDQVERSLELGANEYFVKPVPFEQLNRVLLPSDSDSTLSKILLVEDDESERFAISELISRQGYQIDAAASIAEARNFASTNKYASVVLDLGLGNESGVSFLNWFKSQAGCESTPVIVHTGREIGSEDELKLYEQSQSIVIKSARSPERLIEEISNLDKYRTAHFESKMTKLVSNQNTELSEKTVLIVDDDMRNAYSLKEVLKQEEMNILIATNGKEAIDMISSDESIDIVLMDIMMPVVDGLEAMRVIRSNQQHEKLPIIALTAKAMADDRESCIQAGASDYLSKPVDISKLKTLMKMWL